MEIDLFAAAHAPRGDSAERIESNYENLKQDLQEFIKIRSSCAVSHIAAGGTISARGELLGSGAIQRHDAGLRRGHSSFQAAWWCYTRKCCNGR